MIRKMLAGFALAVFSLFAAVPAFAQSLGDTTENGILNSMKGTNYAWGATVYVGLGTAACGDASLGTEVSGGSYARVALTTSSGWTGPSSGNGQIANAGAVTFPAPTANWGTVTHWFIADASTAGNVLVCHALTTSRTINNGDGAPSFAIGALTITISKLMLPANDDVWAYSGDPLVLRKAG